MHVTERGDRMKMVTKKKRSKKSVYGYVVLGEGRKGRKRRKKGRRKTGT